MCDDGRGRSSTVGNERAVIADEDITYIAVVLPCFLSPLLSYEEVDGRKRVVSGTLPALVRHLADENIQDKDFVEVVCFLVLPNCSTNQRRCL